MEIAVVSKGKRQSIVSKIFGAMVLITIAAYSLATWVLLANWADKIKLNKTLDKLFTVNWYDAAAILICGLGVFLHNYYPQKKRKVCLY